MYIDLCRIQIGVSQPLLELEGREAFFRLIGGEGMPERISTLLIIRR